MKRTVGVILASVLCGALAVLPMAGATTAKKHKADTSASIITQVNAIWAAFKATEANLKSATGFNDCAAASAKAAYRLTNTITWPSSKSLDLAAELAGMLDTFSTDLQVAVIEDKSTTTFEVSDLKAQSTLILSISIVLNTYHSELMSAL